MKSYNPLKMWGSYVGAILGATIGFFSVGKAIIVNYFFDTPIFGILFKLNSSCTCKDISGNWIPGCMCNDVITQDMYIYSTQGIFLTIIICFLIGWGIHSLIRKIT